MAVASTQLSRPRKRGSQFGGGREEAHEGASESSVLVLEIVIRFAWGHGLGAVLWGLDGKWWQQGRSRRWWRNLPRGNQHIAGR